MKIKQQLSGILSILLFIGLVSGFQLNDENGNTESAASLLGIEEAYAGPCNDNGCIGGEDDCMTVEILWGAFKRICKTTVPKIPGSSL